MNRVQLVFSPFVAILGAVQVAILVACLVHCANQHNHKDCECPPQLLPPRPTGAAVGDFIESGPAVNVRARDEMKGQIFRRRTPVVVCPTCPQQPTYTVPQQPTLVVPSSRPVAPATQPQPVATPIQPSKYQLALFLDSSPKSQLLQKWFTEHKGLTDLRKATDFQIYTESNPLYQSRYKEIVPVSQFPVVLFLRPDSGHVHAAGGHMIPASAAELYEDLRKSYALSKSVESAEGAIGQTSGLIREVGYSFDEAISPDMQLNSQICPDGLCPAPTDTGWRPGDRVRDLFNDRTPSNPLEAIIWADASEVAVFFALGLVAVLAIILVMKKR